jgi:predicted RNase H-like HicB family nuclease
MIQHNFTLEYWDEDGWLVGQLREVPSVFSQAKDLPELEANIKEVYELLFDGEKLPSNGVQTKEIALEVYEAA